MEEPGHWYVHGIGTAVPARSLGPDESAELFAPACPTPRAARLLRRMVKLTGIERRYLASLDYQLVAEGANRLYLPAAEQPGGPGMGARNRLFEQAAGPLVVRAVGELPREALQRVGILVTASCTHASSPALEQPLYNGFPIAAGVDRWNLGFMGCSAGLAALRLVHQVASPRGDALAVACELSSLHFQYTQDLDQMTANLLFADGAAAMLLSQRRSAVRIVDARCAALPAAAGQMVWFADDHGLRLELSQELPETLAAALPDVVDALLRANGLRRGGGNADTGGAGGGAGVDHWLVHPGGPQILDAVAACLSLPKGALAISRDVLRRYGNMSSPTIFFIMRELFERRIDGTCVAMAFGPGLTIELVLLRIERDGGARC